MGASNCVTCSGLRFMSDHAVADRHLNQKVGDTVHRLRLNITKRQHDVCQYLGPDPLHQVVYEPGFRATPSVGLQNMLQQ